MNRQEELMTQEGEEEGDGRAEGSSVVRDGGQSCNFTHAWHLNP